MSGFTYLSTFERQFLQVKSLDYLRSAGNEHKAILKIQESQFRKFVEKGTPG
jgi:hypothetical protein